MVKQQELLEKGGDGSSSAQKSTAEKSADTLFLNVANLKKLLPTTTVLVFQVLCPRFTNKGECMAANKWLTAILIGVCIVCCLFDAFTDTYTNSDGSIYYGIVTCKGLLTLDGKVNSNVDLSAYRLKIMDVLHAVVSAAVFAAVAFMDADVVSCYYPSLSQNSKQVLENLPMGVAVAGAIFFVAFPSTRHGISSDIASFLAKQSTATSTASSTTA